jgi:hemerythrin-like domain-containing protein
MVTRQQVLAVVGEDHDYARASDELGIPAGQAYMVATGLPADGGDTFPPEELDRPGAIDGSTQHLVHRKPEAANPTQKSEVHAWVRRRAAEDVPMVAAARQRDAAPAEPEEDEETDVRHVLTRQHDQVTALMEQLKAIPGVTKGGSDIHQSRRESIVDMMTMALSKHETAEQEHFWPRVRDVLANGDEVVEAALEQEQQGKDGLTALGKTEPSDEQFDQLAEELEKSLRKHVAYEDQVLLVLDEAMSSEDRESLGRRILKAERHAPTRPHPHAPKHPKGAVKAAASGGAALDKARDKLGDRPAKRQGRAEEEPGPGGMPEPDETNEE